MIASAQHRGDERAPQIEAAGDGLVKLAVDVAGVALDRGAGRFGAHLQDMSAPRGDRVGAALEHQIGEVFPIGAEERFLVVGGLPQKRLTHAAFGKRDTLFGEHGHKENVGELLLHPRGCPGRVFEPAGVDPADVGRRVGLAVVSNRHGLDLDAEDLEVGPRAGRTRNAEGPLDELAGLALVALEIWGKLAAQRVGDGAQRLPGEGARSGVEGRHGGGGRHR
jgi:hypothetical protein